MYPYKVLLFKNNYSNCPAFKNDNCILLKLLALKIHNFTPIYFPLSFILQYLHLIYSNNNTLIAPTFDAGQIYMKRTQKYFLKCFSFVSCIEVFIPLNRVNFMYVFENVRPKSRSMSLMLISWNLNFLKVYDWVNVTVNI